MRYVYWGDENISESVMTVAQFLNKLNTSALCALKGEFDGVKLCLN